MSPNSIKYWLALTGTACALACAHAQAPTPPQTSAAHDSAPGIQENYSLHQLGHNENLHLQGIRNTEQIEFSVPRDRLVTDSQLDLIYTPSPALLPTLSHMRVYFNDEMMGVVPILAEQIGKQSRHSIPLDAHLVSDFNRIRIELVGHYTELCEDLANTAIWVDISRQSAIKLDGRRLLTRNDFSHFPNPFYDARATTPLELPMVFAGSPNTGVQRAAAILASYFGSQAQWRGARFPVSYDAVPAERHSIVFATNAQRPAFLRAYPPVDAPVVQIVNHPDNPYSKVLLVLGRDETDLIKAATALAVGNAMFRGDSITIDEVQELQPRLPYDAPNWTRTDRPVRFSELTAYPEQLQTSGLRMRPIDLQINLPPDLFAWRNSGIPAQLSFRYTNPPVTDESRLSVSINDRFIRSYPLRQAGRGTVDLQNLRLPLADGLLRRDEALSIPSFKVGSRNTLRFDFSFTSTIGSAQRDTCQTILPPDVRAAVDDSSTIDFSGFPHYLAMPNLSAYADAGFPFSRMADLSDTVVVTAESPSTEQLATLLDAMGLLGAHTGYPAYSVRITDDWDQAVHQDADILVIGPMPEQMRDRPDAYLLLDEAQSWLKQPRLPGTRVGANTRLQSGTDTDRLPITRVAIRAQAPMAAIVGMQAPNHPQRSVVALLASGRDDYALLRDALGDVGKRSVMDGSVVLIRESGVSSSTIGDRYYIGNLQWWQWVWYHLSDRPVLVAWVAVLAIILIAYLLWAILRRLAWRRLHEDGKS